MCGICGRFNADGRPVSEDQIVAMRDVMVHRGPDGEGLFVNGAVGLGHRRLSIIDLAGGAQPLTNEDGSIIIIFNGEIYNFRELRQGLEARGHVLKTKSDTEVIVHLYEEAGAQCVEQLRGMFTFAIWDTRKRELLLARDRLGIKPLYYAQVGQSLFFASEIKGLVEAGVNAEIDPRGLRRYLSYRYPYGFGTPIKGVQELPPGHFMVANASGSSVRRYWDVPVRDGSSVSRPEEQFAELLEEAVKLRTISDVPLGVFLSGGIDSSVVTLLMARHTERVRTFSVGFVPGEENELSWAKTVAERCGAEHHEFILGSEDFFSLLQRLVWVNDEPMIFPASIPLYLLSRESKRKATVMLAGEGADEILAGYSSNVSAYWLGRAASWMPGPMLGSLSALPMPRRAKAIAARMALPANELIAGCFRLKDGEALARACRIPLPSAIDDDAELIEEVGLTSRGGTFLDRLLYFQLKTYLVALLMKQDKMSMGASIESRVPFLDHHLVELAFSLPDEQKISGRTGKHLLRKVARSFVPPEIIDRPKRGFPVPIAKWFRQSNSPFIEALLDAETLRDGLIDGAYVRQRVERFQAGDEIAMELWAILNLELWRRSFLNRSSGLRAAAS